MAQYTGIVSEITKKSQRVEQMMESSDDFFQAYISKREHYEHRVFENYGDIVASLSKAADKANLQTKQHLVDIYYASTDTLDHEVAALDRIAAVLALVRKASAL